LGILKAAGILGGYMILLKRNYQLLTFHITFNLAGAIGNIIHDSVFYGVILTTKL
jgi:lipoprotein signal peptidase